MKSAGKNLLLMAFVAGTGLLSGCTETNRREEHAGQTGQPATLNIATWNVHNLFDTACDSGECGYGQYEKVPTAEEYKLKVGEVASGILQSGADILLLQEIETEGCLRDVLAKTPMYVDYVFGEIGRTASVDVAVVSKYPIRSVQKHRSGTSYETSDGMKRMIARELIEAEVEAGEFGTVRVFVTHLISKASDPDGERREPEAHIVAEIIRKSAEQHPGNLIAFGGDMNDTPESPAIGILEAESGLTDSAREYPTYSRGTWSGKVRLDYIFLNDMAREKQQHSEIVCNYNQVGYSGSDHCMYKIGFSNE